MATFDSNTRPFLPLTPGPQNKLRQKVMGGGPPPRESAAEHGQNLLRQAQAFQKTIDEQIAQRPTDLPPLPDDLQVIIEGKRLQPEQARSLGLTPLEEREDGGILVTVSPDVTLPTLISKAQSYITERTDSGNPRFGGVLAPIEQIRPATREDKAGERLKALLAQPGLDLDQLLWVEVELAGGESEAGAENRQQFYEYLDEFAVSPYAAELVTAASNFLVEVDYSLHRVQLPLRAVIDLLDDSRANWILLMDLLPQVEPGLLSLPVGANLDPPQLSNLADDAPRVVIVDAGLAAEHPLFRDSEGRSLIGRQMNFLPAAADAPPAEQVGDEVPHGHGTAIAAIVAYGSLSGPLLPPPFRLENAKIAGAEAGRPQLDPTQFPKALLREVITAFHHPLPRQCKIFNLSLGTGPHPRHTIANWAEELDNLSAQNDVLFVLPSGDLSPAEISDLLAEEVTYPDYLLNPRARLRDPGQAHSALTVGALSTDPAAPLLPWREQPLAPAHHPAPFSRSGLAYFGGVVKPEVVDFGGNLSRRGDQIAASPETAVLVANRDALRVTGAAEQPLTFQVGTALAAAKVSHLAGRIQAQYPQASANLIRALIVNAAEWPAALTAPLTTDGLATLGREERQTLLRLCGYGVPHVEKALSANAHCMVFVREDQFSWSREDRNSSGRYPAKVSFFSVRLEPDDLFRLPPATPVRVSVTLAYNPPVRKTQRRRYQAVDLRWELKRRDEDSLEFQTRWMREAEESETEESEAEPTTEAPGDADATRPGPWPWQLKPVLNPGSRVRRGSLIRDWFEVFAHELPHTLELVVLGMVAPWRKTTEPLTQPFALVVSIEALDEAVPIYDAVRVQGEVQ